MTANLADLPLLSRLADAALELAPEQVDAWLDALPPEQAHLRPALRRMLALQRSQGQAAFLSRGPMLADRPDDDSVARPGELVGPYRLIREIGRGGMGAVWLAERADGTLKRQVALKLPRLVWGARLAERMARERDIGALLEHPNIARLYDAGVDGGGRPYLALEHVDGEPVDAWCINRALGLPQRLRLFLQIARAVAYAHGRLVVHRDLKPSNVLVTPDGQAHLLDFGIARLLQEAVPGAASQTQEPDRVLTPHYASPEQLRGESITVASDVYSLGVLLYELLTGRLPHEPVRRSLAALEAAVLDDEAPPASSRAGEPRVARALRGELDAILAKALKRRPDERYATADALADDIERQLGGERVLAQPDSLGYRLGKTLRRHRVGVVAAGAVTLAVLGGTVVSVLQARRANDAADRARVVKEFVIDVFKVNPHGKAAGAELRQLPVELLLERGAALIDSRFKGQPALQAELHGVVGGIFAGMGANEPAALEATRQLETQVAIGASATDQAQATLLLAQSLLAQGRVGEAVAMGQHALALAGSDPRLRPKAQALLAHALFQQGRHDDGVRQLDEAERGMQGQPGLAVDAARVKTLRASLHLSAGRFDAARPVYGAAIAAALAAEGPLSPAAVDIRIGVANLLALRDRGDEAKPLREAAFAALRASGVAGELRAALEEANIGTALFLNRRIGYDEARATLERSRAAIERRGVPARIAARIDFDLGRIHLEWGDVKRADALIASSVASLRPMADSVRERALQEEAQGLAALYAGRHVEAEAHFRALLALQRTMGVERISDRLVDDLRWAFARIRQDRGEAAEALALLPAAESDETVPIRFDELLLRGEILCELGRHAQGLALLERALKAHRLPDDERSPHTTRARGVTGLCALAAGQRARAVELAAELAAAARNAPHDPGEAGAYFRRPAERLAERLAARG